MIHYTHALLGLSTYTATDQRNLEARTRYALLAAAVIGSVIPDIDVIVRYTEIGQLNYQMWHRGITHSLVAIPIWAWLITWIAGHIFRTKDRRIFRISLITVSTHIFTDCLNPWGTGLFEPFFDYRVTFGVISYIDRVMPILLIAGVLLTLLLRSRFQAHRISRWVWVAVILHVVIQSVMAGMIYFEEKKSNDQVMLAANPSPWKFLAVSRSGEFHKISYGTVHSREVIDAFVSLPITDEILALDPKAEILDKWAHMLILNETPNGYLLFDPRFYNGQSSFLSLEFPKP